MAMGSTPKAIQIPVFTTQKTQQQRSKSDEQHNNNASETISKPKFTAGMTCYPVSHVFHACVYLRDSKKVAPVVILCATQWTRVYTSRIFCWRMEVIHGKFENESHVSFSDEKFHSSFNL
jgi:hypothetical protein